VFVLGTVAVGTLFVGREGYAQAVYGRGLHAEAMREVTQIVGVGLLCVLFQGAVTFMTAAFNAARKTQIPLAMNLLGGAGLVLVLQSSEGNSLLAIMVALTGTYGVLTVLYALVLKRRFRGVGFRWDDDSLRFIAGVLTVNLMVAIGHWWLLSFNPALWLSVLITVVAGGLALAVSVLCHKGLRTRFLG
jgi:hypothetical protein